MWNQPESYNVGAGDTGMTTIQTSVCIVGGGPAGIGIAAVVRGNDQQIGEPEQRQEIAEHPIKFFQ